MPKTKRAKPATITATNLPAVKQPASRRPPASRPPVSARVDIVLADLKRDPRCK